MLNHIFAYCRLHNSVQLRQQEKQSVSILERKLTELRKEKTQMETQLATERRAKKAEEAATARAVAMATAARYTDMYIYLLHFNDFPILVIRY